MPEVVSKLGVQQVACDTLEPVAGSEPTSTTGKTVLRYSLATDQYTYVWRTYKAWRGTCRQLTIMLDDGTVHAAYFDFTR